MPFQKGHNLSLGHRASTRPDALTQTLISQLNEVNKHTKKTTKHRLVAKMIKMALDGNETMIKEIWDRLEGKVRQQLDLSGQVDVEHEFAGARETIKNLLDGIAVRVRAREETLKLVGSGTGMDAPQLERPRKAGTSRA